MVELDQTHPRLLDIANILIRSAKAFQLPTRIPDHLLFHSNRHRYTIRAVLGLCWALPRTISAVHLLSIWEKCCFSDYFCVPWGYPTIILWS